MVSVMFGMDKSLILFASKIRIDPSFPLDQSLFDHLLDDTAKVAVADPKTQGQLIHLGLEDPIFIAMFQKMRSEAFLD